MLDSYSGSGAGTNSPVVSVVIPCYNSRRFLEETLASVLSQTHRPLEIIAVDDGSTDGTGEILQAHADDVITIRQANAGRSVARNNGMAHATGEFVLFLDSDDTIEPKHLEVLVAEATSVNADLVYCRADAFITSQPERRYVYRHTYFEGNKADRLLLGNFINIHCGLVRRKFLLEHEIRFYAGREHSEDWEFWCRVVLSGATVRKIDLILAHIRDHESNTSRNMIRMYTEVLDVLDRLEVDMSAALKVSPRERLVEATRSRTLYQIAAVKVFLGDRMEGLAELRGALRRFWLLRGIDILRSPGVALVAVLDPPWGLPLFLTRVLYGQHCAAQQRVQARMGEPVRKIVKDRT